MKNFMLLLALALRYQQDLITLAPTYVIVRHIARLAQITVTVVSYCNLDPYLPIPSVPSLDDLLAFKLTLFS